MVHPLHRPSPNVPILPRQQSPLCPPTAPGIRPRRPLNPQRSRPLRRERKGPNIHRQGNLPQGRHPLRASEDLHGRQRVQHAGRQPAPAVPALVVRSAVRVCAEECRGDGEGEG